MKNRFFSIMLIIIFVCAWGGSTAYGDIDYNNTYETAIKMANNDLTSLKNLQDSISMLEQTGAYLYSRSYSMYFQALLELQKDGDFDKAGLRLKNCNQQADFVADLQERNLPSCDELLNYIDARMLESSGKINDAYAVFVNLTVLDSPDRAFQLSISIGNETQPPTIVEDTPTPTTPPISQPIPSVPVLSEVYPGAEAHLRKSNDDGFRVYSYTGPGKTYVPSGGYKPKKQKQITVYFEENDFILADVVYQTAEERFVYLPKVSFVSTEFVPTLSNLEYYTGITTANITPSWGPDNRFNSVSSLSVNKGTSIKIFFQENGFVYAEYSCGLGTVRMWLPANDIEIEGANVEYSKTPIVPIGKSSFK